jgi:hypothetical protein
MPAPKPDEGPSEESEDVVLDIHDSTLDGVSALEGDADGQVGR